MSKSILDWDRLADQFYRKINIYQSVFDEDVELADYRVAGAPFSGALALHRNADAVRTYRGGQSQQPTIDVYSNSGRMISRINWDLGSIRGLGWSEEESLIVVSEDGTVRYYTGLSDDFTPFSLGYGSSEHGVVDCRFWSSGFVALLGNNQLIAVSRYGEHQPKLLATPPPEPVISWTVIPPAYTQSRSVEVLLAMGQTINVVDSTDSEDRLLQNGPFRHISVSPNGRFIALYTDDGKVWVISVDFQERLSEYNSQIKTAPSDMQWCGNDAVVLAWDNEIHLVGPNGVASRHFYDDWVHLVPEVDGIRLFTNSVCEFIQKVPEFGWLKHTLDVTEDIFKLGSTAPASVLLDCIDQLEKRSSKADENIQMIKTSLPEAVDACVAAAGQEYDIHWQKKLLRAASLGKSTLELYEPDSFARMTQDLRILNALRFYKLGLPLSYDQYTWLGPERLIRRLLNRREYHLAIRLSEQFGLSANIVYLHWAIQKVRMSNAQESSICGAIVNKFSSGHETFYAEIARAAFDDGRHNLATTLLNYEPRAGKQVPLLMDMGEETAALDKSIESGDTDLVLLVLFELRKKLPQAAFFRTINSRPIASALVESMLRDTDRELLKDLLYQEDRRLDGANLLVSTALYEVGSGERLSRLSMASKYIRDSKEYPLQARSMQEMQRLLQVQNSLDEDHNVNVRDVAREDSTQGTADENSSSEQHARFKGLSLNSTLRTLILLGQYSRAQKLANDFKMPETTFWWIRLRSLVSARSWRELESIAAKNKKSPIGWEPFFTEALASGNARTAGTFVAKCTSRTHIERCEMYEKCGIFAPAAEEAYKAKDRTKLEELRVKTSGRDLTEVEKYLAMLSKGR